MCEQFCLPWLRKTTALSEGKIEARLAAAPPAITGAKLVENQREREGGIEGAARGSLLDHGDNHLISFFQS